MNIIRRNRGIDIMHSTKRYEQGLDNLEDVFQDLLWYTLDRYGDPIAKMERAFAIAKERFREELGEQQ